jgi:hypothetical protein
MVRAILDGRKTQTRRPIKPQSPKVWPTNQGGSWSYWEVYRWLYLAGYYSKCPWQKGDKLWVREAWRPFKDKAGFLGVEYKADNGKRIIGLPRDFICFNNKWRSPINMPRWVSRITLEIANVQMERVQDISFEDCLAEGIISTRFWGCSPDAPTVDDLIAAEKEWARTEDDRIDQGWVDYTKISFKKLWNSINAKKGFGWKVNPLVWVIEFKVIQPSIKKFS